MKKIFVLFILFFACCGCSNIKYSLKFDKNIEEYITFKSEHNDVSEDDSPDSMGGMSEIEYMFQSLPYNSGGDKNGNYFAGTFYDKPNEIYDSLIFKYISMESVKINGKKFKINITKNDLINIDKIDGLEVSLYIPYFVSKHNADSKKNNVYTWKIDDLENDTIKINFDLSKPADFIQRIIKYSIIGGLVIAIVCVIIYFVDRNKKANEI